MPRIGMVRKSKRTKRTKRTKHAKRHSRRCIFRYKHTRKQHRKQKIQHGGVSDEPTVATVSGFPVVSTKDVGETSVSVQGFAQMTPELYKKMAANGELVVDN
jgi:hypothetical protein